MPVVRPLLRCIFGIVLALQALVSLRAQTPTQQFDTTTIPIEATTTTRNIKLRYGYVDSIRGSLNLSVPVGPSLPGRISLGFNWYNKDGYANTQSLSPIIWPSQLNIPTASASNPGAPFVAVSMFGQTVQFGYKTSVTLSQALQMFSQRGGLVPDLGHNLHWDALDTYYGVTTDQEGTRFLINANGYTYYTDPNTWEDYFVPISILGIIDGDRAYWSDSSDLTKVVTYIGDRWGNLVSLTQPSPAQTKLLPFSMTIRNERKTTDTIQLVVSNGGGTYSPYTAQPVNLTVTNTFGGPATSGVGRFIAGLIQTYDSTTMQDVEWGASYGFLLDSLSHNDGLGNLSTTTFQWGWGPYDPPASDSSHLGPHIIQSITYPSLTETFGYIPLSYVSGAGGASRISEMQSVPSHLAFTGMKVTSGFGIACITSKGTDLNGADAGWTSLISRTIGNCTVSKPGYVCTVDSPLITTVLTYPNPNPSALGASSPFRGTQFIHPQGFSNLNDFYPFVQGAVVQERSITGTGAPTVSLSNPSTLTALLGWQPSSVSTIEVKDFSGWTTASVGVPGVHPTNQNAYGSLDSINGIHIPLAQATKITIRKPNLPVRTIVLGDHFILGSQDAYGPLRSDVYHSAPEALPGIPGPSSLTWQTELAAVSGGQVQETRTMARHWDLASAGLLMDSFSSSISGPALPGLRGGQSSVNLGTVNHTYDGLSRKVTSTTVIGNAKTIETWQYLSGQPLFTSYSKQVLIGGAALPYSGQVGKSVTYGAAPDFWITSETDSLTRETITYNQRDTAGRVTVQTDSRGVVARTQYDAFGRVILSSTDAKGVKGSKDYVGSVSASIQFDPNGRFKITTQTVEDASKPLTTREDMDSLGRVVKTTKPDGSYQLVNFNGFGDKLSDSPWLLPAQTSFGPATYPVDAKGRVTAVIDPQGRTTLSQPNDPAWGTRSISGVSVTGVVTETFDDRNFVKTEVKDFLGQVQLLLDPNGGYTKFSYDAYGRLASVNRSGQIRTYSYNEFGWLLSRTEPEEGTTTFSDFTALGTPRTTTQKGRSGTSNLTTKLTTDLRHRITNIQALKNGVVIINRTVIFRDDWNLPTGISETQPYGSLSENYGYDTTGRLITKSYSDGKATFSISQTLDPIGNPLSLSYPTNAGRADRVTWTYDDLLRPSVAYLNGLNRGQMTYNQVSGTATTNTILLANGASTVLKTDRGELVRVTHSVNGTMLQDSPITWSAGGLMLSRGQDSFGYDGLRRLTSATTLGLNAGESTTQGFQYDIYGNRISSTFTYQGPQKPDELMAWTATYNSTNSLPTQVQTPGGPVATGVMYDDLGRITDVYAIPGVVTSRSQWEYDPTGRMTRELINGVATNFLLDGTGLRFKRLKADGSIQYTIYGFNREPLTVLNQATATAPLTWSKSMVHGLGQLLSEEQPSGTQYIQSDYVGSPNFITNSAGTVVGQAKNLPFGERFGQTGQKSLKRFAGHEDQIGSAIYMQARSYLPAYGRFAQPDPGYDQHPGSPDSWDLYSYVSNNPVTNTDLTGMAQDLFYMNAETFMTFDGWLYEWRKPNSSAQLEENERRTLRSVAQTYQSESAAAVKSAMDGDLKGYFSHLGTAWKLALTDPEWLLTAAMATAAPFMVEGPAVRAALVDEMAANGVKFTEEALVATGRTPGGKVVFLEKGHSRAGLQHIVEEHGSQFAGKGITEAQIPRALMRALERGQVVGTSGSGANLAPVIRTKINGTTQYLRIGVASNGYIVQANPVNTWKPIPIGSWVF